LEDKNLLEYIWDMAVQLIGVALGECVLRVSGHLVVQVGGTRFRREIIYVSFLTVNWSRGVSPPSKENSAATGKLHLLDSI